ncbi:5676_t:CDS:2, partial [Funneliformis mosseae]
LRFAYATIPIVFMASTVLMELSSKIGGEIENPFGRDANDLDLNSFCEIILRSLWSEVRKLSEDIRSRLSHQSDVEISVQRVSPNPEALKRLKIQDPTFDYHTDQKTGQMLIEGMGKLHLEISVEKLREKNLSD